MKIIDVQITENFKLSEFCTTSKNFDNFSIPIAHFNNICYLAFLLQKIRDVIRIPICISSGYRPETLNVMVDGVKNSFHLVGAAADVYFDNHDDYQTAWNYAKYLFDSYSVIEIAELLGCPDGNWFHLSINNGFRDKKHIINSNYY